MDFIKRLQEEAGIVPATPTKLVSVGQPVLHCGTVKEVKKVYERSSMLEIGYTDSDKSTLVSLDEISLFEQDETQFVIDVDVDPETVTDDSVVDGESMEDDGVKDSGHHGELKYDDDESSCCDAVQCIITNLESKFEKGNLKKEEALNLAVDILKCKQIKKCLQRDDEDQAVAMFKTLRDSCKNMFSDMSVLKDKELKDAVEQSLLNNDKMKESLTVQTSIASIFTAAEKMVNGLQEALNQKEPVNVYDQEEPTVFSSLPDPVSQSPEYGHEASEVVEVPKELLDSLEAEIKELHNLSDKVVNREPAMAQFYNDTADVFQELHNLLKEGTVDSIKRAQIYLTSLKDPMFRKVPDDVWDFLSFVANGGRKLSLKYTFDKVKKSKK